MESSPWDFLSFQSVLDLVVWVIMVALFLLYFWALVVGDASEQGRAPLRHGPEWPATPVPAPHGEASPALV